MNFYIQTKWYSTESHRTPILLEIGYIWWQSQTDLYKPEVIEQPRHMQKKGFQEMLPVPNIHLILVSFSVRIPFVGIEKNDESTRTFFGTFEQSCQILA